MIEAKLGVITCDKCGKPMKKDQKTLIIAEGIIRDSNEVLDFGDSDIIYACHTNCWVGFEEPIEKEKLFRKYGPYLLC